MRRVQKPSLAHQKTGGSTPATEQKKRERAPPMLAKRLIVAAFAVLAVGLVPLALPGERDLFVDVHAAPQVIAAN